MRARRARILHGDCLSKLRSLPDASVDSLVTDPPAGISFMGAAWDGDKGGRDQWIAWLAEVLAECYRVLKPGAHGLVWALPRTSHWTGMAIERAGFTPIDQVFHHFGSGFPKSLNAHKSAEKQGISCECEQPMIHLESEKVRVLPQTDSQTVPQLGAGPEVLRAQMLRSGTKLSAQAKALSGMPEALDTEVRLSGYTREVLQQGVSRGKAQSRQKGRAKEAASRLQAVWEEVLDPKLRSSGRGVLLPELQRQGPRSGVCKARAQGPRRLDHEKPSLVSREDERGAQPSLEGRRHVQAEQGKLHRPEVRSMSEGLSPHGSQGRVRNGASARHGAASRAMPQSKRSRASSKPQDTRQSAQESRAMAVERNAQARGAWPVCGRCKKSVIPEGLGTALKPATEIWWLIRKPLSEKNVAANVLRWGTGALNVDASRIGTSESLNGGAYSKSERENKFFRNLDPNAGQYKQPAGRWPANLLLSHHESCEPRGVKRVGSGGRKRAWHKPGPNKSMSGPNMGHETLSNYGTETVEAWACAEGCAVAELDRQSGNLGTSRGGNSKNVGNKVYGKYAAEADKKACGFGDSGGASRFFQTFAYVAKPSRRERGQGNNHPCVKPQKLLRYLARMITPPGGVILDPFLGSGSMALAALAEGFRFIGVEKERDYVRICRARIAHAKRTVEECA